MGSYTYDVFVSHSAADRAWVAEQLVPRLEAAGLAVAVSYRDFLPGTPLLESIEQVVATSRHALVVVTPAWTADEWNAYEARLTHTFDPNARRRKLIPVRLKPCAAPDCQLPRAVADLVMADFTDPRHWDAEFGRLIRSLRPITPPPAPGAQRQGMSRAQWLGWWFSYNRWRVLGGGVAAILLVLAASALIGWPTFAGWRSLGRPIPQAWRLYRAGDVLLVSTSTDSRDCKVIGEALWRSADAARSWETVFAPLRSGPPGPSCIPAAVRDFGHASVAPQIIFAATSNVGLLRSADGGEHWVRVGEGGLPETLAHVVVSPTDPELVFAAAEGGGLFRSRDGGATWERLDRPEACPRRADRGASLPVAFPVGAMIMKGQEIVVGQARPDAIGIYPQQTDGLYASQDDGACWMRVDDAQSQYSYLALAAIPGAEGELLAITYDHRTGPEEPSSQLWHVQRGVGRTRILRYFCGLVHALMIVPGQTETWYAAGQGGQVYTGPIHSSDEVRAPWCGVPLNSAGVGDSLPSIRRCVFGCDSDLATDAIGRAPLLLMGERVYRFGRLPWPQALWP